MKKVITRFDVVAMGDHFGRLGIADSAARVGLQPLGISFELVTAMRRGPIPPGISAKWDRDALECDSGQPGVVRQV